MWNRTDQESKYCQASGKGYFLTTMLRTAPGGQVWQLPTRIVKARHTRFIEDRRRPASHAITLVVWAKVKTKQLRSFHPVSRSARASTVSSPWSKIVPH